MVIGEKVTLEEMGGARMHTSKSGVGHALVVERRGGDRVRQALPRVLPVLVRGASPRRAPRSRAGVRRADPRADPARREQAVRHPGAARQRCSTPTRSSRSTPAGRKEVIVGYARLDGRVVGVVANQPKVKGGVLFVDSSDKAARFIWTCNAFNIPLLFLADVPGFMIGTQVERDGIIRHGAKMISAVSEATVPKISVIVRKAYGAGLYAMAGPAFDPDCCLALPTASIAVMGPPAAINAVYYNQLQAIEDPERAGGANRGAAARVRAGHRHPAPGLRAGRRRGDPARGSARRADQPVRARGRQARGVAGEAQPGHTGLNGRRRGLPAPWVGCVAGRRSWRGTSRSRRRASARTGPSRRSTSASTCSGVSRWLCERGSEPVVRRGSRSRSPGGGRRAPVAPAPRRGRVRGRTEVRLLACDPRASSRKRPK